MDTLSSQSLPTNKQPETPPVKKKHHRLRWTLIILFGFILLVVIGVGATGLYDIPVVSAVFGANKPKDLGVHPTAADWASVDEKTPLEIQGAANDFSVFGEKTYSGEQSVSNELTSAEITAWIQHYTASDPYLQDIQVKFREGGMEISFFAKRYLNASIYVDVDVARTGPNSAAINIRQGKIGRFNVPQKYLDMFNDYAEDILNDHLADIPGFSMDNLEYHNGYRVFKGTYPQNVTSASGEWW